MTDRLGELGEIVDLVPLRSFDDAAAREVLGKIDVLVTGWGCPRIDAGVLRMAPRLRLIAHAAGTVKYFLEPEVWEQCQVTQAAAANALPVAEFTLAAILFANKQVLRLRDAYRGRRVGRDELGFRERPIGNWKKVIGIVGASQIGRHVIRLLQPFAFDVLLYDPFVTPAQADRLGVTLCPLDALMAQADVVSLHAPALPATRAMIGAAQLGAMRDGTTLINTARGHLVDHAALEAALVSGRIDAFIDVTDPDEVLPPDSPLYDLPNVFLTPHVAGAMGAEQERLGLMIVEEVERWCGGQPLEHAIAREQLAHLA